MSSHFCFHFFPLIICLTLHNKASLKKSFILSIHEVNGIKQDDALQKLEIKRNNAFLSVKIEVYCLLSLMRIMKMKYFIAECLPLSIQENSRNSRSRYAFCSFFNYVIYVDLLSIRWIEL